MRIKPLDLSVILIFTLEILFPQHILAAQAQVYAAQADMVITTPVMPIPFRDAPAPSEPASTVTKSGYTIPLKVRGGGYMAVSAYNSEPEQCDSTPYITASGTYTRDGVVASNYFPIGTKLRFPEKFGDKVFRVEDRMNSRYFDRIDIWMADKPDALAFGVRYLKYQVVQ